MSRDGGGGGFTGLARGNRGGGLPPGGALVLLLGGTGREGGMAVWQGAPAMPPLFHGTCN
eukprot:10607511-Prorocentrum_lima.AAC.1